MINIKKPGLKWLMKFGWPIIKYVLVNYGEQIAKFVSIEIKERIRKKKLQKMDDAFVKAKENEDNAEKAASSEERLRFYELAKAYKDEGEFQRKSLDEFEREIESVIESIVEDVVNKSNKIEFDNLFEVEGEKLKASNSQLLLTDNQNSKKK